MVKGTGTDITAVETRPTTVSTVDPTGSERVTTVSTLNNPTTARSEGEENIAEEFPQGETHRFPQLFGGPRRRYAERERSGDAFRGAYSPCNLTACGGAPDKDVAKSPSRLKTTQSRGRPCAASTLNNVAKTSDQQQSAGHTANGMPRGRVLSSRLRQTSPRCLKLSHVPEALKETVNYSPSCSERTSTEPPVVTTSPSTEDNDPEIQDIPVLSARLCEEDMTCNGGRHGAPLLSTIKMLVERKKYPTGKRRFYLPLTTGKTHYVSLPDMTSLLQDYSARHSTIAEGHVAINFYCYKGQKDAYPVYEVPLQGARLVTRVCSENGPCLYIATLVGVFEFQSTHEGRYNYMYWESLLRLLGVVLVSPHTLFLPTKERLVGEGSFAKVYPAVHQPTGAPVAIKKVPKDKLMNLPDNHLSAVHIEIDVLRRVYHPFVVAFLAAYEDDTHYYIVLERLSGGNVYEWLRHHAQYTEVQARAAMFRILSALAALEGNGIVHRDLKLENLVLEYPNDPTQIKVIDFGLAAFLESPRMSMHCGSPGFVAPEIISKRPYGTRVDMFSVGVLLYSILCGRTPFHGEGDTASQTLYKNRQCQIAFDARLWRGISASACDLVSKLLTKDPAHRLSPMEALTHAWMLGSNGTTPIKCPAPLLLHYECWQQEVDYAKKDSYEQLIVDGAQLREHLQWPMQAWRHARFTGSGFLTARPHSEELSAPYPAAASVLGLYNSTSLRGSVPSALAPQAMFYESSGGAIPASPPVVGYRRVHYEAAITRFSLLGPCPGSELPLRVDELRYRQKEEFVAMLNALDPRLSPAHCAGPPLDNKAPSFTPSTGTIRTGEALVQQRRYGQGQDDPMQVLLSTRRAHPEVASCWKASNPHMVQATAQPHSTWKTTALRAGYGGESISTVATSGSRRWSAQSDASKPLSSLFSPSLVGSSIPISTTPLTGPPSHAYQHHQHHQYSAATSIDKQKRLSDADGCLSTTQTQRDMSSLVSTNTRPTTTAVISQKSPTGCSSRSPRNLKKGFSVAAPMTHTTYNQKSIPPLMTPMTLKHNGSRNGSFTMRPAEPATTVLSASCSSATGLYPQRGRTPGPHNNLEQTNGKPHGADNTTTVDPYPCVSFGSRTPPPAAAVHIWSSALPPLTAAGRLQARPLRAATLYRPSPSTFQETTTTTAHRQTNGT